MNRLAITLIILLNTSLYAQQTFTIQAGKKDWGGAYTPDYSISGEKMYYHYYETDNKTISSAIIDIESWKVEKEGINSEELLDGVKITNNISAKIKNNILMIYDDNLQVIAEHEFTLAKGYNIKNSSYTNDPAKNRIIFYIVVSNENYGWSENDAKGYFLYFDRESQKIDVNEIDASQEDFSIDGILSPEVIDNKIIMDVFSKGVRWAILDLETGKFSSINFNAEAKYFSYNVLTMAHQNYFIFRAGNSTSKSIVYYWDQIFKVDMESGDASYIAMYGNKSHPLENVGRRSFNDHNEVRMTCGFVEYEKDKFVNFSIFMDTVRIILIQDGEYKYLNQPSINVTGYDNIYYQLNDHHISLVVDGSKQLKPDIKLYTLDLESKELSGGTSITELESGFQTYQYTDFYYNGEKDVSIEYSITKNKKTGLISFVKTK